MSELRHPLCLLRCLWWSFRAGAWVSGHDFKEAKHAGGVHVLHCIKCGHASVGFYG